MLTQTHLQQLQLLWQQGEQFDASHSERREKRLNITPDTGKFLYQLSRSRRARTVLEIGTSNGFSTVWLALAAKAHKGRVFTIDASAHKTALAHATLEAFGVSDVVDARTGDAFSLLADADDEAVDILFLDADRARYAGYWPEITRIMAPGGLVVMDNAVSHATECADFIAAVLATHGYLAETYPIGKGQFVILKDL